MSDELQIRPQAICVRAFVETGSQEEANAIWENIDALAHRYGTTKLLQLRPYWKIADNFEILFLINPHQNCEITFNKLRASLGRETSALRDGSVIWVRDKAHKIIDPQVTWLSIELVDEFADDQLMQRG